QKWAGLVVHGAEPAKENAAIFAGDRQVGYVTYSDHGYSLGQVLATAHLDNEVLAPGTELEIEIEAQRVRATVAALPFFDPEGVRLRG
ncbi:MAG: glycine cleavage T C-terminal barrel domain-containing protein, partial [Mesorhizobium sp.]|nr:glycine cleavage T C-terminal barrel domain-containing protein [Mesorhizobium sp.]